MSLPDLAAAGHAALWAALTIAVYLAARRVHARFLAWWSAPLLLTWTVCLVALVAMHVSYRDYMTGAGWLMSLLGPATVAFAIPVYEARGLIARHWRPLAVGVVTGSALSIGCSALFALWFGFSAETLASLLPRSISTPFAMSVSGELGGVPGLTASFTAITGLFGVFVVAPLIRLLGIESEFARGSLLGMGAHGAGVARAYQFGETAGSIASVTMILTGLFNVLLASLFVALA